MSLSRSPSPLPGGGWASPGLNPNSGRSSPLSGSNTPISWQTAKTRSAGVGGYPSFSTHNQGFFTRHMRRISNNIPRFGPGASLTPDERPYAMRDKPNLRRNFSGSEVPLFGRLISILARISRKTRFRLFLLFVLLFGLFLLGNSRRFPCAALMKSTSMLTFGSVLILLEKISLGRRRRKVCCYPRS